MPPCILPAPGSAHRAHRAHRITPPRSPGRSAGKAAPWVLGAVLALVLTVGTGWWVMHRGQPAAGAAPSARAPGGQAGAHRRFGGADHVQPISVGTVRRQDVRVMVDAIGTIAAANTAVVRPKVDGELQALHFVEGQTVQAGALLAEIDPRPYRIALAQAQGQLTRDQAQWQNARLDQTRFHDLLAKDGIAKQQVDTQDALVQQLAGTVQSDQAQVDNARLQLSYTRVTAPIAGRIGLRQADLGNVVHTTDANGLLTIVQTRPVNVVFSVPESHLPRIVARLKAGAALPVEAWDREQQQRLAVGRVASIDNAIDASTGTIKLKAAFANADGSLFPNQFVNVRLQVDTLTNALTVPAAALLRGAPGTYVYVVNRDKTVSTRPVKAGPTDGERVSVQGELQPGETVVTDGVDRLRDGARVDVIAPAASAAGTGRAPRKEGGRSGQRPQ